MRKESELLAHKSSMLFRIAFLSGLNNNEMLASFPGFFNGKEIFPVHVKKLRNDQRLTTCLFILTTDLPEVEIPVMISGDVNTCNSISLQTPSLLFYPPLAVLIR